MKSLLYTGFFWAVDEIWTKKEWLSDCSIPLKTVK
jgi:hypothetical protein